ncbi:MAG: nucleoside kinase, partial [Bacteroidales bacterium]|nr:nucleoside kinase [Bacteroidales bacterium]
MVRVYCKNTNSAKEVQEGLTLMEILPEFDFEQPYPIIAAKVNNVSQGLKYRVYNNQDVEFVDYRTYVGRGVYRRSLCFLLCKAANDLFPGCRITLRRPIAKGYLCDMVKKDGSKAAQQDIDAIKERMQALVDADVEFHRHEARLEDAIEVFRKMGYDDKVKLLETSEDVYVKYYTLEGTPDYFYDALLPSTGYLKVWELTPYHGSFILRVPNRHNPEKLAPFYIQDKTFDIFLENIRWNKIMNLENVGDVNLACRRGEASNLIQVSEALQEKKIVQIAETIHSRFCDPVNPIKVVLITGPSSSGKSTFCRRLSIQIMACGIQPVFFSTDDYFVNRVETPKLPDGSYDFDNFETVDHKVL